MDKHSDLHYFLRTPAYTLSTPAGIAQSERTLDVPFGTFAANVDLQERLHLLSTVRANPSVRYSTPLKGEELKESVATYIAAFIEDRQQRRQGRDYLMNNGLVRILVEDETLMPKLREVLPQLH